MALLDRVSASLTAHYRSYGLDLADLKMETGRIQSTENPEQVDVIVIDDAGFDNSRVFAAGRLLGISELHERLNLK